MAKSNPMRAVQRKKTVKTTKTTKKTTGKKKSANYNFLYIILIVGGILGTIVFLHDRYKIKNDENKIHDFVSNIPEGFTSIGIDVSHHQGKIPWTKILLKSPLDTLIDFVYCKATEGSDFIDSEWETNRNTLNELGVKNGAYHFFNPETEAISQAKHFISNWKKKGTDLPPVLDVETEAETDMILIQKMYDWLEFVEKETGIKPIIYTNLHFYETKFKHEFKTYKFWIASYTYKPLCIDDKRIIHWQFTNQARLPEIDEEVDVNVSKLKF